MSATSPTAAIAAATRPTPPTVDDDRAHRAAVWAMSAQQRIDAMWAGTLTISQLCEWTGRRPSEVPRLGGEFAWIVIRTPEWADAADEDRDNIVHLPGREEHRAAA